MSADYGLQAEDIADSRQASRHAACACVVHPLSPPAARTERARCAVPRRGARDACRSRPRAMQSMQQRRGHPACCGRAPREAAAGGRRAVRAGVCWRA